MSQSGTGTAHCSTTTRAFTFNVPSLRRLTETGRRSGSRVENVAKRIWHPASITLWYDQLMVFRTRSRTTHSEMATAPSPHPCDVYWNMIRCTLHCCAATDLNITTDVDHHQTTGINAVWCLLFFTKVSLLSRRLENLFSACICGHHAQCE